jgi:magnesium transporter
MRPPPPTVLPDTDQETVAAVALAARTSVVPVADTGGRFLGIVPPLAIIDVLHREHDEDVRRLVGITERAGAATSALTVSPRRRAASRLPWLLAGLGGCFLSAVVMAGFEHRLAETIAVAFFVPAIVYLADAIGTQTEAVAVRGLSLERLPLKAILVGELATGALLGLLLGALAFPAIALLFGVRLAAAVGISIFAAGALASVIGLFFPWLLSRYGYDPAFGSGPIATIVQDVLSLIVYFAAVSLLM